MSRVIRKGTSLAELIVSMGAGSMLLLLAIGIVHQCFHSSSESRERSEHSNCVMRFSERFRLDSHAMSKVVAHDTSSITFGHDGDAGTETVRYVAKDNVLTREGTASDSPVHHEMFRFARGSKIQFGFDAESDQVKFVLLVGSAIGSADDKVELEVVSRVGAWRALESIARNEVKP